MPARGNRVLTEYLELKVTDCKHCYKCIRNCPVKAIRFSQNQATIMQEECVLCGRCFVSCPQNAKRIHSDLAKAKALIAGDGPVVASIAPSFVANYPGVSIENLRESLLRLGFSAAEETALGATLVKRHYDDLVDAGEQRVIVSTCCHTVNMLVQKHYPEVLPALAAVLSPMQAHAVSIREAQPEAKVVFIGPCISKKAEVDEYPSIVDCALTFEELDSWLAEKDVPLAPSADLAEGIQGRARLFPTSGGILRTMERRNADYDYISVDGIDHCISALEDIASGNLDNCFIEMSACSGSCTGGPAMSCPVGPVRAYARVNAYAPEADFSVRSLTPGSLDKAFAFDAPARTRFSDKAIGEVLAKIGKVNPEDELNCGSCGYDTCREKAVAVLEGKANLEMCLPYLMNKAQSFSDLIIENTPNGIVVVNEDMEVQQINGAAQRILNVKHQGDVLGRNVVCVMDPTLFLEMLDRDRPVYDSRQYLAEYGRYVIFTLIRDREYGLIICIMRDVTDTENTRAARRELADKTIRVTDEVINKQMRTVQEIASLLGETAAETKIALSQLKETLRDD